MNLRSSIPTADDVTYLYKLLLNRYPESDDVVKMWISQSKSLGWLIHQFLTSEEFKQKNSEEFKQKNNIDLNIYPYRKLLHIKDELAGRHAKKELYQPIYGLDMHHDGPIQRECIERCDLVRNALRPLPLKNMTVLDVGCNMGYVTFELSKYFSKVVGLEYEKLLYEFCCELKNVLAIKDNDHDYTNVNFEKTDFFSNYSKLAGSYDVCLLFSVIHYLVAGQGIERSKSILSDIVSKFDYVVIELSSSKDYEYMPENAAKILENVTSSEIIKLGNSEKNDRPIYLLKKKDNLS